MLCNNAALQGKVQNGKTDAIGDPLEVALLEAGAKAGIDREEFLKAFREVREEAFDLGTKMMATFH